MLSQEPYCWWQQCACEQDGRADGKCQSECDPVSVSMLDQEQSAAGYGGFRLPAAKAHNQIINRMASKGLQCIAAKLQSRLERTGMPGAEHANKMNGGSVGRLAEPLENVEVHHYRCMAACYHPELHTNGRTAATL